MLATALLLAAVTAGGLSFTGNAFAGVAAGGIHAVEPASTPTRAADWYLHHHWTEPAFPGVTMPAGPPPPAGPTATVPTDAPAPSAPATTSPDPVTTPAAPSPQPAQPPKPATHKPSHAQPARTKPAHAKPATTEPTEEPTRAESGSADRATVVEPQVQNGAGAAVADVSGAGVAAEPLSSEAPDTRGLDERFPDPAPSPSTAVAGATRLSASEQHARPPGYGRSLVLSGLLGLGIAIFGLMMVTRRRRTW